MENTHENQYKENSERRNSNTEYQPTKCRITKPPPPKPAANPLQFIKINPPSQLYKKAQEQIKKVEETKVARQEVREEAEDWQANLDNWKSSRRKLQEHIIERVVEVKKLTQEEQDRSRRRNKTFSEMMEERSKGRHKINIPVYNDEDSNDLSDYGIGSSSSKANSVKDVDTDDSMSMLDEKEHKSSKNREDGYSQSQSEDERPMENNNFINSRPLSSEYKYKSETNTYTEAVYTSNKSYLVKSTSTPLDSKFVNNESKDDTEKYTYEGAIQDYRSRIKSRINIDESIFNKPQDVSKSKEINEVQSLVPKGNIFKRKEIFEGEKNSDSNQNDSLRRFSEDFANAQSIKERLKSLEKCVDQPIPNDKTSHQIGSVKSRVQSFDKPTEKDVKNNNTNNKDANKKTIRSYLMQESSSSSSIEAANKNDWKPKDILSDRSSSPEAELYMNKLNMINQDFDNLMYGKLPRVPDSSILQYVQNSHYTPSSSSTELMAMSSDREDSGIHTADVSCSVSQADEPFDDPDIATNTIPHCIEKLNQEKEQHQEPSQLCYNSSLSEEKCEEENCLYSNKSKCMPYQFSKEFIINTTEQFLFDAKTDSTQNKEHPYRPVAKIQVPDPPVDSKKEAEQIQPNYENVVNDTSRIYENVPDQKPVYENVIIRKNTEYPIAFISGDILAPPKMIEPPKVKPPPPPPSDLNETDSPQSEPKVKRVNSTKRIKKEIQIKRSSFLGLDEPISLIDPELSIEKPPDVDLFLKQESRLEKSFYKKLQGSREGGLSEVDSQDSGLEVDRGRLSSDTWCSSFPESGTPIHHGRQDSEQTNSYTSEEEEIMKKEREIIAMVEKEEMCRDIVPNSHYSNGNYPPNKSFSQDNVPLGKDFNRPFIPPHPECRSPSDEVDTRVLKMQHELLELEREELERQQENMLLRDNAFRRQNRYSLENICDSNPRSYPPYNDYRKSMPELQHLPQEFRKPVPDLPRYHLPPPTGITYHKSMPDIQHAYRSSLTEFSSSLPDNTLAHQKSMPDLDHDMKAPIFRPPPPVNRQPPILLGKPTRPYPPDQRDKKMLPGKESNLKRSPISAHNIHTLSAAPKPRPIQNDMWVQPKAKAEMKNYNQHWLYQEAELRRLSEKNKNWPNGRGTSDKHLPDAVIHTLTQRMQNRPSFNDPRSQHGRDVRPEGSPSKAVNPHTYLNHPQTMGHALPSHVENQDKVLSVSGKKKCSYCNNELGRGAAMIIESLCLFYHMECFKCCVCHTQLGDGFMGTDVRVRNQKLHCHNCYSSDDGVKFSCV